MNNNNLRNSSVIMVDDTSKKDLSYELQNVFDKITSQLYDAHNIVSDVLESFSEYCETIGITPAETDMENWEDYTVLDTIKVLHDEIDRLTEIFDALPFADPPYLNNLPQNVIELEQALGIAETEEPQASTPQGTRKKTRIELTDDVLDIDFEC